jgi:hypothetical protein
MTWAAATPHLTLSHGSEARPDVAVGRCDKSSQCDGVHLVRPAEFDVPHAFAGALQKSGRIVEHCPVEEADIRMSAEGVDVPERRVSHTRGGMAIMQKFANVRSAAAHLFKPRLDEPSQPVIGLGEPGVDAGVSRNGIG